MVKSQKKSRSKKPKSKRLSSAVLRHLTRNAVKHGAHGLLQATNPGHGRWAMAAHANAILRRDRYNQAPGMETLLYRADPKTGKQERTTGHNNAPYVYTLHKGNAAHLADQNRATLNHFDRHWEKYSLDPVYRARQKEMTDWLATQGRTAAITEDKAQIHKGTKLEDYTGSGLHVIKAGHKKYFAALGGRMLHREPQRKSVLKAALKLACGIK